MSDHDAVEPASNPHPSRRKVLQAGLFALSATQLPDLLVSRALAQGVKPPPNLVGKLEGAEVVTDLARYPKSFKEAPQLAELVKAGKLPPVQERIGQDPLVVKPLREIGKYGGTWRRGFTGPADTSNGHRAAQNDKLLFFDYTGTKLVPNIARAWEVSPDGKVTTVHLRRGMKWSDGAPFTADDFVFWFEDVYSNREVVPVPLSVMTINGKPLTVREGRRQHRPVRGARPVLRPAHRAGLGVGHRPPCPLRSRRAGRLRARPLPQAVPSEVRLEGRSRQEAGRAEVRELGPAVQEPQRRLPQPRPAGGDAVEDGVADQHADLGPGAQPVQRLGRHRRQPAALHRPHPHDPGREPGAHQPARHRRRVRLAGPPHRHQQAAGAAGEPAEGQLPGAPGPVRPGRRRRPLLQPELRQGSRDRQVARHPQLPHRALARHRPPADQRDVRARPRPDRLGGAGRAHAVLPGAGVQDPAHRARREEGQRAARRAGAHEEGQRGLPPARRRPGPPAPGADDLPRLPGLHAHRRDDRRAVEGDRHPRRDPGDGARPGHRPHCGPTSTRSTSRPSGAPTTSTATSP